ncbi:hypothetical protein GLAREA_12710 [Glarea lozoyensis ATCC 20868]|nr:uncharacterized protein GLAREA_12710 [Glarea lozoyensis ATCC 20868]EPE31407.1 hypothetical protein GLAREA_12710 [Glarea lozoyensis ATCC 20868]
MAVENSGLMTDDEPSQIVSTTKGKKGRASARGKRNTSNVSAVQATAAVPNDEELDAALAADLERPLSDEEPEPVLSSKKPGLEESSRPDHHMFGVQPADVDEAAIEAELEAMEMESKPLPKARATKAKQPRKVSAKQQAAAKKAAEAQARAEAEAEALAEAEAEAQNTAVDEASLQVAAELEQSISLQHSSPVIQAKKQRSSSRQPAKKALGRATRGSTMLANETHVEVQSQEDEPLEESDESIASQSTVVRGGRNPKSSGAKTVKGSKKSAAHEPEVIVDEASPKAISVEPENSQNARSLAVEDRSITEDAFFTPAPDGFQDEFIESTPKVTAVQHEEGHTFEHMESPTIAEDIPAPVPAKNKGKGKAKAVVKSPRSATPPPPADSTPSQSPQSSDAENHPPSSKPSAAPRMVATPSTARRLPLGTMTPVMSPSKRNIIAGLQSSHPWTNVDLDSVFTQSPGGKNLMIDTEAIFGKTKGKNDGLTCPEKQMTVEEWIQHNAQTAEGRLKTECERMVSTFESQGTRAMMALEGLECSE